MTKSITMAACLAWVAVAATSAQPANAEMLTGQNPGPYVTCAGTSGSNVQYTCGKYWTYWQSIRFVSTACSSGACSYESINTTTDIVYSTGRKSATSSSACPAPDPRRIYALGSCSC